MANQSLIVQTVVKACHKAGRSLMRDLAEIEHISKDTKTRAEFVRNAAIKSERIIASELSNARHSYHFLMKKGGYIAMSHAKEIIDSSETFFHRWVINTIDGEQNFASGHSDFTVNVALERILIPNDVNTAEELESYFSSKAPGNTLLAVCYMPAYGEMYWAEKGVGTHFIDQYDNPRKISISKKSSVRNSIASISCLATSSSSKLSNKSLKLIKYLQSEEIRWRCSGCHSIDMINLIRGKWDIAMSDSDTQYTEHAAIKLLLSEADIPVISLADKSNQIMNHEFVAANKFLLNEISSFL